MAPPEHAQNNKPKPAKPAKPSALKKFALSDMPPASSHEGVLVAVTIDGVEPISLAYSDGEVWLEIAIAGELAIPAPAPDDGTAPV